MSFAPAAAVAVASDWLYWPFEPGAILGLGFLAVAYALAATRLRSRLLALGGPPPRLFPVGRLGLERPGFLARWQPIVFYAGVLIAALALLSPLHPLGEGYLLSAHMLQHLLITLVVPPLLLLGTPGWMLRSLLRLSPVRRAAGTLLSPLPAFVVFNFVFLAWHVPPLYEFSLHSTPAHALEHAAFGALALVTWWPVLGPLPEFPRLPYGGQMLYLFFESLPPTILGAIITLAEVPIYRTYWQAPRAIPSLDAFADQQLAGLIMWLPGALAYFAAMTVVWFIWMERRSPADPPYRTVNPNLAKRVPDTK